MVKLSYEKNFSDIGQVNPFLSGHCFFLKVRNIYKLLRNLFPLQCGIESFFECQKQTSS